MPFNPLLRTRSRQQLCLLTQFGELDNLSETKSDISWWDVSFDDKDYDDDGDQDGGDNHDDDDCDDYEEGDDDDVGDLLRRLSIAGRATGAKKIDGRVCCCWVPPSCMTIW